MNDAFTKEILKLWTAGRTEQAVEMMCDQMCAHGRRIVNLESPALKEPASEGAGMLVSRFALAFAPDVPPREVGPLVKTESTALRAWQKEIAEQKPLMSFTRAFQDGFHVGWSFRAAWKSPTSAPEMQALAGSEELDSCPFCGSATGPHFEHDDDTDEDDNEDGPSAWWVSCGVTSGKDCSDGGCGAESIPSMTREGAAAAWNRREPVPAPAPREAPEIAGRVTTGGDHGA